MPGRATPQMLLLCIMALANVNDEDQGFVIGSVDSGRRPELEQCAGCLARILPVYIPICPDISMREMVNVVCKEENFAKQKSEFPITTFMSVEKGVALRFALAWEPVGGLRKQHQLLGQHCPGGFQTVL